MEESQHHISHLEPEPLVNHGFKICDIPLGKDSEGAFGCTLVMRTVHDYRTVVASAPRSHAARTDALVRSELGTLPDAGAALAQKIRADNAYVLYLHGWSDYFFQEHVASAFNAAGFDFCAIDLRKHGRSLRDHHTPTAIDALESYEADIATALAAMNDDVGGNNTPRTPLIYAHSTGGLTATLWAADHPHTCSGLILNSPWLDIHFSPLIRVLTAPFVRAYARHHASRQILPSGSDSYARSHRADFGGEWTWHESYKPARGFPFPASTMAAVMAGHARVAQGLTIQEPILVATSMRSAFRTRWSSALLHADTVIDVRTVRRHAHRLGPRVRAVNIPGAAHDIALSTVGPRRQFMKEVVQWLAEEWAQ